MKNDDEQKMKEGINRNTRKPLIDSLLCSLHVAPLLAYLIFISYCAPLCIIIDRYIKYTSLVPFYIMFIKCVSLWILYILYSIVRYLKKKF